MLTILQKIRRLFFTRILVIFNLSAVAFAFQACYGTPQDIKEEVMISGYVTASGTGEPIQGIEVNFGNSVGIETTNTEGYYYLFVQMDTLYNVVFHDIDGEQNGIFLDKSAQIINNNYLSELGLDVVLQPKNN